MNKAILIGNLTKDVELSSTPSGVAVAKFTIAVNRNYKGADGNREVDFFPIVAWRGLGENCAKYLSKGKKAAVTGEIQNLSYEDKDGNKRYVTEIVAQDVEFLSTATEQAESSDSTPAPTRPAKKAQATQVGLVSVDEDDDLPF